MSILITATERTLTSGCVIPRHEFGIFTNGSVIPARRLIGYTFLTNIFVIYLFLLKFTVIFSLGFFNEKVFNFRILCFIDIYIKVLPFISSFMFVIV